MPGFIMLDASESIPWSRRKSLYGPHRIGAIASMSWTQQEIRELKVNRYVLVDEEPCRILSIHGNAAQLMDLGSYETFDIPVDQEFAGALKSGDEILYVETMGRRKLTRP